MAARHFVAVFVVGAAAVCVACGAAGGGGAVVTRSTSTVTTVACDGSTTTYVITASGSSTSGAPGGAAGQITPQTAGGPFTPTPPPTPRIVRAKRVELADIDSGSTIVVSLATSIVVSLGPQSAPFCSSAPVTSDPRVLAQLSSTSSNDRTAHGTFMAHAVGTATLEATFDPRCYPPCEAASARWQVTVEVTP